MKKGTGISEIHKAFSGFFNRQIRAVPVHITIHVAMNAWMAAPTAGIA